jgi:putative transposase
LKPAEKRELVDYTRQEHGLSIRKACGAISISRSMYHYHPYDSKDDVVISTIQEIAERYRAYGFNKVFTKVRRAGHLWNHKTCVPCLLCIEPEPQA